jgi:hypothetical protein
MRALVLAGFLLTACLGASPRCDVEITSDLAFTGSDAHDTVTVRAFGPSCDKATGLYDIRTADGEPIWAWSAPLPRAFGDVFAANEHDAMRDFLERWAQPAIATTQNAPAFETLEPESTTLDRLTYEDLRARDLPMLCHASGTRRETCVFWEPAAGAAGHFYDREAAEP